MVLVMSEVEIDESDTTETVEIDESDATETIADCGENLEECGEDLDISSIDEPGGSSKDDPGEYSDKPGEYSKYNTDESYEEPPECSRDEPVESSKDACTQVNTVSSEIIVLREQLRQYRMQLFKKNEEVKQLKMKNQELMDNLLNRSNLTIVLNQQK